MSNRKLLSNFYFGFELEGTYDDSETSSRFLEEKFNEMLDGTGYMHGDGSLRADYGFRTFEYSSPVIQFTPKNVQMVVKFFDALPSLFVKINRTCGLHTHISYKGINRQDICWLMASMASDESYKDFLKMGRTNFYKGPYAKADFFKHAHLYLERGQLGNFSNIICNNEKYRSMRIHPQGTLEWRGPRTFLNVNKHSKNVAYMKKLTEFIIKINKTLDLTETPLISKEKFLNYAKNYINNLSFKDDNGDNKDKFANLIEKLNENPHILKHIREAKFNEFCEYIQNHSCNLSSFLRKAKNDSTFTIDDERTLKFFLKYSSVETYIAKLNPSTFKSQMALVGEYNRLTPIFEYLIRHEGVNDEVLSILTKEALKNFGKASIRTFTFNAMKEMVKYNINAFKAAINVDLVATFGDARARELISRLVQQDQYGFKNSELYNSLLASVNRNLVINLFPEVNQLNNNVINTNVSDLTTW